MHSKGTKVGKKEHAVGLPKSINKRTYNRDSEFEVLTCIAGHGFHCSSS